MKKSPYAPKNKLATFSISQKNIKQIDELMSTQDFPSKSEIVRQAITAFHWERYESRKPKLYAEVQAKRLAIKERAVAIKDRLQNMSPEEYCSEILTGMTDGHKCYVPTQHPESSGNPAISLDKVKDIPPDEFEAFDPVVIIPNRPENQNDMKNRAMLINEAWEELKKYSKHSQEWHQALARLREEMTVRYNSKQ